MNILFVNSHAFYSEPLGSMQLSAIARSLGHTTRLMFLTRHSITDTIEDFRPDLICYSAMTPNEHLFQDCDETVRDHMARTGRQNCFGSKTTPMLNKPSQGAIKNQPAERGKNVASMRGMYEKSASPWNPNPITVMIAIARTSPIISQFLFK